MALWGWPSTLAFACCCRQRSTWQPAVCRNERRKVKREVIAEKGGRPRRTRMARASIWLRELRRLSPRGAIKMKAPGSAPSGSGDKDVERDAGRLMSLGEWT